MSIDPVTIFPDVHGTACEIVPDVAMTSQSAGEMQLWRYRKAIEPRYLISAAWSLLTSLERVAIESTVDACAGDALPFWFIGWRRQWHRFLRVSQNTDGVTTSFDLPGIVSSDHVFTLARGTATGATPTYTIVPGGGSFDMDAVVFNTPPAAGYGLTVSMYARRYYDVQFEGPVQPFQRDPQTGRFAFSTVMRTRKRNP